MDIVKYLLENGIAYDDLAYCIGCSRGYLIEIAHGKPCSKKLKKKIFDILEGK